MITAQHYSELGRILRYRREDRKVDLKVAAQELHIRTRYLEALEAGTLEEIPGDVYVKGYMTRYAAYLGLAGDEMVEAYVKIGALPQRRLFHIPERMRRSLHPTPVMVIASTALALTIAALFPHDEYRPRDYRAYVMAPPMPAEVRGKIRMPGCLEKGRAVWPPCFYERNVIYSRVAMKQPLATILDLGK